MIWMPIEKVNGTNTNCYVERRHKANRTLVRPIQAKNVTAQYRVTRQNGNTRGTTKPKSERNEERSSKNTEKNQRRSFAEMGGCDFRTTW